MWRNNPLIEEITNQIITIKFFNMKRTLIIAALSGLLLSACSGESKTESTADSSVVDTTITTTVTDTTPATAPVDTLTTDSATKAHGHTH